ncbi:MAG: phosphoribosylanthranilate isomerase [Acidobacteriaceae bacterium]
MWVKICGTTNLEDARVAVEAGADALGFVFAKSPRRVTAAEAGEIISRLGQTVVEKIGVFVDADFEGIVETVLTAGLSGVQLHGDLDSDLALRLRERFTESAERLRILQVLHFGAEESALDERLAALRQSGAVDAVLVDSQTAQAQGGTGVRYDWAAARRSFAAAADLRMVVAGGLRPENVGEAIATLDPWGVDVVSGVEAAPGRKDPEKVRAFVELARSAALHLGSAGGV